MYPYLCKALSTYIRNEHPGSVQEKKQFFLSFVDFIGHTKFVFLYSLLCNYVIKQFKEIIYIERLIETQYSKQNVIVVLTYK